jgi:hypothetical protein
MGNTAYFYMVPSPRNRICFVRFQVLTVANMKMTVSWVVAPCSLGDDDGDLKHL